MTKLGRFAVGCLTAALTCTSLTGCSLGTKGLYNRTMFTYVGMDVPMKSVWIETLTDIETSSQYYGNTLWDEKYSEDEEGNDITFKEAILQNAVSNVSEVYAFLSVKDKYDCELTDDEKKEVEDVVSDYKSQFKEQLDGTPITDDDLTEAFTNNYMATKIYEQMSEEYKKELDATQYSRNTYYDFCIGKTGYDVSGSEINLTDEEITNNKKAIEDLRKQLVAGKSIDDVIDANSNEDITYSSQQISIGKDNQSNYEDEVVKAASKLKKDGDFTKVIETDSYFHVIVAEKLNDEDATDSAISLAVNDKIIDEFIGDLEDKRGELNYGKDVDKSCIEEILKLFTLDLYTEDDSTDETEELDDVEVSTSTVSNSTSGEEPTE